MTEEPSDMLAAEVDAEAESLLVGTHVGILAGERSVAEWGWVLGVVAEHEGRRLGTRFVDVAALVRDRALRGTEITSPKFVGSLLDGQSTALSVDRAEDSLVVAARRAMPRPLPGGLIGLVRHNVAAALEQAATMATFPPTAMEGELAVGRPCVTVADTGTGMFQFTLRVSVPVVVVPRGKDA